MTAPAVSDFVLNEILNAQPLPGMPPTATRLMRLSRDPANGPAEYAALIEADPGLAVQLLRFVNSSYFGFRSPVASIKQAIVLLGIRAVMNFVLCQAIFKLIPNPPSSMFDLKALWRDSLRRGLFARTLSKRLDWPEAEEAFAGGLLQDMAIPLLAKRAPEEYGKIFFARCTSKHRARLSQLEEHVFGWNHAIAGGALARKWELPESLAALIQDHLNLDPPLDASPGNLARFAVALSALLPADGDSAWLELGQWEEAYAQVRPHTGPSTEDLLRRVDEEYAEIAPLLQFSAPRVSLVESYRQAVARR